MRKGQRAERAKRAEICQRTWPEGPERGHTWSGSQMGPQELLNTPVKGPMWLKGRLKDAERR